MYDYTGGRQAEFEFGAHLKYMYFVVIAYVYTSSEASFGRGLRGDKHTGVSWYFSLTSQVIIQVSRAGFKSRLFFVPYSSYSFTLFLVLLQSNVLLVSHNSKSAT